MSSLFSAVCSLFVTSRNPTDERVSPSDSCLFFCVLPDRCLPAHAALCARDATASPARNRRRGPAAQAGAPQTDGQVCPFSESTGAAPNEPFSRVTVGEVRAPLLMLLVTPVLYFCMTNQTAEKGDVWKF